MGEALRGAAALARAGRWLSTTTFLAAASDSAPVWSIWRPRQSRGTRAARADEVAEIFRRAVGGPENAERERARQFYLELRTLALLDDLRYNFRPRPFLRVRRHALPPVVFIPRATRANGGIVLLRVISDVRSRRSELDPLLVIAGLTRAGEAELHARTVVPPEDTAPGTDSDPTALYLAWLRNQLPVGQSPSVSASLPWVLPIRLPVTLITTTGGQAHDTSPLGPPKWVRNAPRLVAALLVTGMLTGAGVYVNKQPKNCDPNPLHEFDRDTVRLETGECYGISDGSVVFEPQHGVRLNGATQGRPGSGKGAGDDIDLAALMERIRKENDAAREAERRVVVFYAGEITAPAGNPSTALNGLRELAGVHARQKAINNRDRAGTGNQPKIIVEVANGGHGMDRQAETVDRIVGYQREHSHEVLGVVGFSRDRESTHDAVRRLLDVGLNVVAPQNSDDFLAKTANYFNLAATNREEGRAFQEAITAKAVAAGGTAVILTPPPGKGDIYSEQQARAARSALDGAGLKVFEKSQDEVEEACELPLTALYFTGRAEELPGLADVLSRSECASKKLALLTGDDTTKSLAAKGREALPSNVTLYYASLAAPKRTLPSSQLPADIARVLSPKEHPRNGDPLFEDGTMALAYDAMTILYEAAQEAEFQPEFVNGKLLTTEARGASGRIDLTPAHRGKHCGHTLALFKVVKKDESDAPKTTEVYYRGLNGTLAVCPADD